MTLNVCNGAKAGKSINKTMYEIASDVGNEASISGITHFTSLVPKPFTRGRGSGNIGIPKVVLPQL